MTPDPRIWQRDGPLVLAHRGGARLGPENSLEVLASASAAGADAVEIDVQELTDGTLLTSHAHRLRPRRFRFERGLGPGFALGLGSARLDAVTREQYERVTGVPAITVADVLGRLHPLGLGLYLDVKRVSPAGLERLIDAVVGSPVAADTVVGSFHPDLVRRVADDGRLPASLLYRDPAAEAGELRGRFGCSFVHPCFDDQPAMIAHLAGRWMRSAHDAGVRVVSWNSNEPAVLAKMALAGFDVLCTDDPRLVTRD